MKKKYLKLYYKWMKTGLLPKERGLCLELNTYPCDHNDDEWIVYDHLDKLFVMMHPSPKQYLTIEMMWGGEPGVFTPLRQTVILFMAAMNGEL